MPAAVAVNRAMSVRVAGDFVKSLTRFRQKALIIPRSSKLVVA